jgi:hypothetical protein
VRYYAVTVTGRRIEIPALESFDGAAQVGGGAPEAEARVIALAQAVYAHLLVRVERQAHVVWSVE